jgi:hypothetical protein
MTICQLCKKRQATGLYRLAVTEVESYLDEVCAERLPYRPTIISFLATR